MRKAPHRLQMPEKAVFQVSNCALYLDSKLDEIERMVYSTLQWDITVS